MIISAIMIRFTYQFPTSPVSEENGCTLPIKSNPALQNAEMLWKMENQIPFESPNLGQKWNASKKAPKNSIENVPIMIKRVIFTIPPICGAETEFCINDLDTKPILRFVSVMIEMQSVMNPIPPIWIRQRMTPWPKKDQWVYVSTWIRPVTHVADVAVKKPVNKLAASGFLVEIGRAKSIEPIHMIAQYPNKIIFIGERWRKWW